MVVDRDRIFNNAPVGRCTVALISRQQKVYLVEKAITTLPRGAGNVPRRSLLHPSPSQPLLELVPCLSIHWTSYYRCLCSCGCLLHLKEPCQSFGRRRLYHN